MAAPRNLSFNHTSSSEQQQSLQTPDTSSLLIHDTSKDNRLSSSSNTQGFQSLEELLNDAGVITVDTDTSSQDIVSSNKRSLTDPDFPIPTKKLKGEESNDVVQMGRDMGVSAGMTHPPVNVVPSILSSHSTNYHIPFTTPQSSTSISSLPSVGKTSIPLINPAASIAPQSSANSSIANNPIPSSVSLANVLGNQPPLALGSISLLVQLYKQFQSQGNIQGMQKIKDQLTLLQSQLIAKSKNLSGQTGLTGTINITPTINTSNSFQPVLVPTQASTSTHSQLLNGPSIVTNGIMNNKQRGTSTATINNKPPFFASSTPSPSFTVVTTSNSITPNSGSGVNPAMTTSNNLLTGASMISSTSSVSSGSGLPSAASVSSSLLLNSVVGGSVPSLPSTSVGPSFVTHNLTPTVSPQLPLGLQVTPQTQANVLKAVYSYRLQQIQEFLASLPPSQKPTTTQELRELLIKNNVLSKALPADFLTQLQKMSPQISMETATSTGTTPTPASSSSVGFDITTSVPHTSLPPSVPLTTATASTSKGLNITGSSTHTVTPPSASTTTTTSSLSNTNTPSTSTTAASSSSSSSSQSNVTLPGVTLETLKTLCRLPQADFVRIPMPVMLTTIVQFLRANKWTGNSSDLPGLLKQAQEALAKNVLPNTTTTSAPPAVVQATKLSTPSSQHTAKNKTNSADGSNSGSPLSQLMASFGMKGTPTVNHMVTSSVTSKPLAKTTSSHTNNVPVTRQQSKAYQEQLEREKIANLQKILQSSEEARIAFRFKAHVDKLNQQLLTPDIKRPFTNWQDLILRLLPYHVYREPELPAGAMEKADAVYEGIAGVLLSRAQGLMSRYQQIVVDEQTESNEDRSVGMVMDRLWLDAEKERKEEEEKQKKEAEEIAAELSAVGGGLLTDSMFDSDPFLLETDSYDDDPFLSQIWGEGFMDGGGGASGQGGGDPSNDTSTLIPDFNNTGIT